MRQSSFAQVFRRVVAASLVIGSQFASTPPSQLNALSSTYGGLQISASSLLGDSGCVMPVGGPIVCKAIGGTDSLTPDLGILTGQTITDFSGDRYTSCAISSSFAAYCWGDNAAAALGDNTTTDRAIPTPVYTGGALSGVSLKKIAANYSGACAVSTIGRLYCWGESTPSGGSGIYDRFYTGQSPSTRLIPPTAVSDSQLTSLTWADVEAIGTNTICAMSTTRVFKCFGASIVTYTTSSIPSSESIISMSAAQQYGDLHACALSNVGNVYCNGAYYFRPAVSTSSTSTFSQVALPATASSVRVSDGIACAVLSNGGVSCWGYGMQRSTGLGISGYPVVNFLPSGSNVSEATLLTSYGSYPVVIIRKTTGQLLKFSFTSNNIGAILPNGVDAPLRTPIINVDEVNVEVPTTYSVSCEADATNVCVKISGSIDPLSSTTINYKLFSDPSATVIERSATAVIQYSKIDIGTVNGATDHWLTLTVTGPFGTTTTSLMKIPRQYSPPSNATIAAGVTNYSGCFDLNINEEVNDGGLDGDWSFTIKNLQTGSTVIWDRSNGCLGFFKTSSRYRINGTFTSALGSASTSATFTTDNLRLRRSVYKYSRYSLKSLFLVHSPGRKSWSASQGCSIRGGYLYTTGTYSCLVKLKITAVKGYVASTSSYRIRLR